MLFLTWSDRFVGDKKNFVALSYSPTNTSTSTPVITGINEYLSLGEGGSEIDMALV